MRTYILLENAEFYAYHGVLEQERTVGNVFVVNLKIEANLLDAIASDALDKTINYADLLSLVRQEMEIPSKLLEHVAGRIAGRIKGTYPQVKTVEIKLSKRNPPMDGQIESAGVVIID